MVVDIVFADLKPLTLMEAICKLIYVLFNDLGITALYPNMLMRLVAARHRKPVQLKAVRSRFPRFLQQAPLSSGLASDARTYNHRSHDKPYPSQQRVLAPPSLPNTR